MKKVLAIFVMMMVLVATMVTASADYWDDKTMDWLYQNTIDWCNSHGYEDWTDCQHFSKDGDLIYGCFLITKDDGVLYDATPETITNQTYIDRAEEALGVKMHSIELIHYGQEGGYDIYRLIIKWDEPLTTADCYGARPIYGEDVFVRFYN